MAAPYEERAEEVTFLLEQCGLARYAPAFRNDDVDDSCLDTLTPEDLHDLGLPMGPRVRLARAIRERNAAAASVAPSLPPPPPLPVSMRAATPPPRDDDGDDEDLCVMCMDSKIDCKLKPCEHALFCRACVANWRRQSAAKPKGPSCPKCREPFGAADVVDLDGRPLDAPRPVAWGGAAVAPVVVPFPGAAEAEARRRREAEARAAADADALRRRREAEAVRAREARRQREAEAYAAAEAEARRRREAEAARVVEAARARAVDAAALATAAAARHAGVWASRALAGKCAAAVREEALERARAAVSGQTGQPLRAYVDAYAAAATGAFEDAAAAAAAANALDAAVDRDNATAAVVSVYLDEAVASCRRDAAAAAIAEVAEAATHKLTEIAGEVLMLVDAHGGTISTTSLGNAYKKWYGKDVNYTGTRRTLTNFLKDLPGVEVIPGTSAGLPSWIRRATALAPITNPRVAADVHRILQGPVAEPESRSASPDPTAAIWTRAAAPGFDPHPGMYSYPPPAYSYPSVPVGAYVMPPPQPVPLLPAPLLNPFVLQPVPRASRSRNRGQKKGKKEVCLSEFVVESCVYYGCVPWDRSRSCSGQNGFSTASRLPTRREGYAIQLAYLIALMRRMTRWASMSPHTPITQRLSVGK